MGKVRAFLPSDIAEVSDMHRHVFGGRSQVDLADLGKYFKEVFFDNPWYEEDLPSLVFEEAGKLIGFVGVLPRRMSLNGKIIRAAVSTQLMVLPCNQSPLAAVSLLRRLFAGPQDFSYADGATDRARKLWTAAGGKTALLYSVYWTRVLRPGRFWMAKKKPSVPNTITGLALKPFISLRDMVYHRTLNTGGQDSLLDGNTEDLTEDMIIGQLPQMTARYNLRPDYDSTSLRWLMDMAARKRRQGRLHGVCVRDAKQDIAGWYLRYSKPGGISRVLQIAAREDSMTMVLDHMINEAWQDGAVAITGRLNPRYMHAMASRGCEFHRGIDGDGRWAVAHARDPRIIVPISRGDAFLSTLEGEGWLNFMDEGPPCSMGSRMSRAANILLRPSRVEPVPEREMLPSVLSK